MHSIRTDFGFNLLRSASKLKRGVIEKIWWVLLVFRIREFSFPNLFVGFFLPWIVMGTLSVNHFQSNLFYILYDIRLSSTFLWLFFPMWSSVFVLCCFFSSWITGHIHRSIVDKIDLTSEYVEMVKKKKPYQLHWGTYFCEMWSEKFIYRAFNWSVKILLMNREEDHPLFF